MENLFDLSGKVAVVTGTSRGLGQYFGRALAQAGADLVITSRRPGPADGVQRRNRRDSAAGPCPSSSTSSTRATSRPWSGPRSTSTGRIDILVNNAGLNIRHPAVEFTWKEWDTVLNTNLKGAFFVAQAVGKEMMKRKYGRIINIGSCTCVFGMEGIGPYSASRGGILQISRSLAAEWGRHGITVNVLAPGWFKTAQNKVLYDNEKWVQYITDRIPLGRPGQPNDLDGTVIFLASDASAYITGQILLVDGGFTTGATKAIP